MKNSLPNGRYVTLAGSTLEISGDHGGIARVAFDWLEEGGCFDCEAEPYPLDGRLVWRCDECGGGSAAWIAERRAEPS